MNNNSWYGGYRPRGPIDSSQYPKHFQSVINFNNPLDLNISPNSQTSQPHPSSQYNSSIQSYGSTQLNSVAPQVIIPTANTARHLGLLNLGNTCFMSSVLQVLFDIFSFSIYSYDNKPVTEAYMKLRNSHSDLDCEMFKQEAGKKIQMILDYDQEDAHQFLCGLLEALNRENQEVKYLSKVTININPKISIYQNWQNFCYQMSKADNSLITRLLGGEVYTELKCPVNHSSYLFQRVLNISLPFPENPQMNHLQDFLINNFEGELIDGVTCDSCQSKVQMIKRSLIYNPPNILILHLKRFKLGYMSNSKIRSGVIFDEILTLDNRYLHPDIQHNSHSYRLFALVHHSGGLNGGHYYTQKRISNKWFLYNDKQVSQSGIFEFGNRSQTVYMLFYGRL